MTESATPKSTDYSTKVDTTKLIRTFKMHADKMKKLLDRLDEQSDGLPMGTYEYRKTAILFIPDAELNEQNAYLVATRFVNSQEVSFLFGGFFHANKSIVVRLTTLFNAWEDVKGHVHSCRHIDGSIHEVVVRFEKPIDASLLTTEADSIRVLIVEDEPLFVQVAKNYLTALNAEVDHAANGEVGVEMALRNTYDAVLMDMEMPVMNGLAAIKKLREKGYAGTIVAVTGMTREDVRAQCRAAGCDAFIGKPYSKEHLATVIRDLRGEPIYSEFENDPSMRDIIQLLIKELPNRLRQLNLAINAADEEACEIQIRALKASTGACGFSGLCELADHIEVALHGGVGLDKVQSDLKKFARLCNRIRTRQQQVESPKSDASDGKASVTVEPVKAEEVTHESASAQVTAESPGPSQPQLKIRCA